MKEMTARQREVLEFMRIFGERHGVPPTVREIGERFRFTARAAFDHLRALERKGMLERRVTGKRASRTLCSPPQGRAAGGRRRPPGSRCSAASRRARRSPRWRTTRTPSRCGRTGSARAGRTSSRCGCAGDSMIEAHIVDGDLVLVRKQETAAQRRHRRGHARREATVKRFAREGGAVVLRPEHPTMKPIVVEPGRGDFRILGKVVGIMRQI